MRKFGVKLEDEIYLVQADMYSAGWEKHTYNFYRIISPARFMRDEVRQLVASFENVRHVAEIDNVEKIL